MVHAKAVKFIKVQQRQATTTVLVFTGYLCKCQFNLPIVVTKQRIAFIYNNIIKLHNNKIQGIIDWTVYESLTKNLNLFVGVVEICNVDNEMPQLPKS